MRRMINLENLGQALTDPITTAEAPGRTPMMM
jgi:hypothetical protein